MRVSERSRYAITTDRIERAKLSHTHNLDVISSQKAINSVKDNPTNFVRSMKIRDSLGQLESIRDNLVFSKGFTNVAETAISNIQDILARAKELALSMANDTFDGSNRAITAKEIAQLKEQMVQTANSQYSGKYVFSGFRSSTPPLDSEGNYLGDDGEIYLELGPGKLKGINVPGRLLLEADDAERQQGHFNMVDTIALLQRGLESDDKISIYKAVEELDYQMQKSYSLQASVGAIWNSISSYEKKLDFDVLQQTSHLSTLEDADIFKASSDFKKTEALLQSTLLASNQLLSPSLLNYMR